MRSVLSASYPPRSRFFLPALLLPLLPPRRRRTKAGLLSEAAGVSILLHAIVIRMWRTSAHPSRNQRDIANPSKKKRDMNFAACRTAARRKSNQRLGSFRFCHAQHLQLTFCLAVIRLDSQCFSQVRCGLIAPAELKQRLRQIVMRFGLIGP